MIPIIYDSAETVFDRNGIGRLQSCIDGTCVEERNGVYEVDFSYPIDGENFDLLQCGRIIGVTHDESGTIQPFDIVSFTRPINGIVTFHAEHISYRQRKLTVAGTGINSIAAAFNLLTTAQPSNPFTYSADFESTAYMAAADGIPRSVRQLLGGVEGSILDAYGGEYEWDNFRVILHNRRGRARDFAIRYGVNLLDYKEDTDYRGTYSSCIPYWKGNENGSDVIIIGDRVDVGGATYNGRNDCIPLDMSDKFEGKPTKAQLEAAAASYMQSNQTTLPSQTIAVDFVRLQDMGYEWLGDLLQCNLCDTINVEFPRYGMKGSYKIVKTVWNFLEDRYESMELGQLSTTLADALGISNSLGGSSAGGTSVEQAVTFTGTRSNAISRGECFGTYDKNSNTVTLIYHFYNTADIPTSYTLFTIPEAYRPTTTRYGGAMYTTGSGGVATTYHGYITNGGLIRQDISSSCRTGFGVIQYILN